MRVFALYLRHIRRLGFWIFWDLLYLIDASNTFFLESFLPGLRFWCLRRLSSSARRFVGQSGVEILFFFFADSVLYGRFLCIHGVAEFFGSSTLGIFGAPCFRSGLVVDIRNFDF